MNILTEEELTQKITFYSGTFRSLSSYMGIDHLCNNKVITFDKNSEENRELSFNV